MKAEELMIGDYVKLKDAKLGNINFVGPVVQIKSITGRHVLVPNAKGLLEDVTEEYLLPVPLTPEILEKNGFDTSDPEVKQYHFTEDGQSYHFSLRQMYNKKDNKPNGYSFYAFSVLTIIEYVHQLQHALRLCDINHEIIL